MKILYYLFFTAVIFIALLIFMEIIDLPFYEQHLSGLFRGAVRLFDF
jgi:membrane associated rhomboid family serine protease